ncbi:MAG: alpha/beta hydrolase [Acidimicrobiales bacterium]|nr:alpha/beta hydrolase [Acidimicrobiales bacterium]
MTMDEHFAQNSRGGTQLRRRWKTDGARGAVLIVHGIGEHSGRYVHVGDHLAARGYDVLAYDQVGFGQSEGRRGHVDSFDDYLDDVEALLAERRELDVPVVLIGHSLGGLVSATYLEDGRPQPDLAVLSAPALGAVVPAWQRVMAPIIGRVAPKVFIPSKIDGAVLSHDPQVQSDYENDPLGVQGATAGLGRALFEAMDRASERIGQIGVPTYVLQGTADELVPPHFTAPLASLPTVTYRSWDGLRHECFNEYEKNDVMDEMADWIDQRL